MKKESSNNSAYIVSSLYDKILFITAPLIAVAIAVIGYTTDTLLYQETFFGTEKFATLDQVSRQGFGQWFLKIPVLDPVFLQHFPVVANTGGVGE